MIIKLGSVFRLKSDFTVVVVLDEFGPGWWTCLSVWSNHHHYQPGTRLTVNTNNLLEENKVTSFYTAEELKRLTSIIKVEEHEDRTGEEADS